MFQSNDSLFYWQRRNNSSSTIIMNYINAIWLTMKLNEVSLTELWNIIDDIQVLNNTNGHNYYIEQIKNGDQIDVITDIPYTSTQTHEDYYDVIQYFETD